mmetsp:Transcript_119645/g.333928  ORF Transcript_119645/g.333928 Transcript_119645/m.333928 type:complete len:280 (+) Transcript_119645:65-904(+)
MATVAKTRHKSRGGGLQLNQSAAAALPGAAPAPLCVVPADLHHLYEVRVLGRAAAHDGHGLADSLSRRLDGLVPCGEYRRTRLGEALGPLWDRTDTKPVAQVVAEVAAVAREDVVLGDRPLFLQLVDELCELLLRHPSPPHHHGLAVGVALAAPWQGAEDRVAGPRHGVAVAPLAPKDLHPAMEDARAQLPQETVEPLRAAGRAHVVDVQCHVRRCSLVPRRSRAGALAAVARELTALGEQPKLIPPRVSDAHAAHPAASCCAGRGACAGAGTLHPSEA